MDPLALTAFLAVGAVAGLLAGLLGIGGGVVIVPALIWVFGHLNLPGMDPTGANIPQQAVATSLATIIATGGASALAHHRRGAVAWPLVGRLAPGLVLGAWLGALLAAWIPGDWLARLFALFLIFTGVRMLTRPRQGTAAPLPANGLIPAAGTLIGALSAMLGIGGGVLLVPFLTRHGIAIQRAVATSSACGIALAVAGSIGFAAAGIGREGLASQSLGFIYWPAALAIVAASVPMAPAGAWLAHRLRTATLKRVFGVLLIAVALRLLLAG